MLKNLLFTSLTSLYYAIIPVYFSAKLFPKRTNSKALISITIAVSIILLWFLHMLKLYGYESETTTLIQLIIFFNIFVLFKGSILEKDLSHMPETLILTAEFDPLRDEGEEYGKRLKEANNYVEIHRIPDALHGYFALGIRFLHVQESFEII